MSNKKDKNSSKQIEIKPKFSLLGLSNSLLEHTQTDNQSKLSVDKLRFMPNSHRRRTLSVDIQKKAERPEDNSNAKSAGRKAFQEKKELRKNLENERIGI